MKTSISILFILMHCVIHAQIDTLYIVNGQLPENVFIEGYPYQESNEWHHNTVWGPILNSKHQNLKIFNSTDSTGYNGIVKFTNNGERQLGQTPTFYNEFLCSYKQGAAECCEMREWRHQRNNEIVGEKLTPWIQKTTQVCYSYSDLGKKTDSTHTRHYNQENQLTEHIHYYEENKKDISVHTYYINNDTTFHGKEIHGYAHGKWLRSVLSINEKQQIDSALRFYCVFVNDTLKDVLDHSCLYLGKRNEILDKSTFFELYPNLMLLHDFEFLAMHDQSLTISDEHKIILTVNKKYFSHPIPKKVLKKIKKRYQKTTYNKTYM